MSFINVTDIPVTKWPPRKYVIDWVADDNGGHWVWNLMKDVVECLHDHQDIRIGRGVQGTK